MLIIPWLSATKLVSLFGDFDCHIEFPGRNLFVSCAGNHMITN